MFVTNWISTTKIQKISEITNFFRHYFLSRTEVSFNIYYLSCMQDYGNKDVIIYSKVRSKERTRSKKKII